MTSPRAGFFSGKNMKEIEANKNGQPVPTIFAESFPNGFGNPAPEIAIDQITGDVNREFIARMLKWRNWIQMMSE